VKKICVLVALLSASVLFAEEKGLKPDGFCDLKWGDPAPADATRHHGGKDPGDAAGLVVWYDRANEKPFLGSAEVDVMRWAFFHGRFDAVFIGTRPGAAAENLRRALVENWGSGSQPEPGVNRWVWSRGNTTAEYAIPEISIKGQSNVGELWISSKSMTTEIKEEKARAARSATGAQTTGGSRR
jgi:hypothetical protein